MKFLDYFRVGFKNLARQKTRTFLTIVAITVGSLSLMLMASIIVSIRQSLVDQFQQLGAFSLVTVVKDPNSANQNNLLGTNGDPSEGKKIDDTTLAAIRTIPHVAAATPITTTYAQTMRLDGVAKKTWASITGFDPATDVFHLDVAYGRKLTSADMDKIVIGSRFVQDMGYGAHPQDLLGKKMLLTFKFGPGSAPDWGALPEQPPMNADKSWYESKNNQALEIPAEIIGIIDGNAIDDGQSYINLAWARKLNTQVRWEWKNDQPKQNESSCAFNPKSGKTECQNTQPAQPTMTIVKDDPFATNGYNSIIIRVDDQQQLIAVAKAVTALGYGANTAQAMLDQINKILGMVGIVLAIIGGISLFVASIGIINTMIMATFERIREIGVMRACGATKGTIRRLFTFEAALLGFFGGLFGLLIAFGLGQIARLIVNHFHASLGNVPVDRIGSFPWWLMLSMIAFTTLIGMIAGLYPAFRASRMNPVEALRYE